MSTTEVRVDPEIEELVPHFLHTRKTELAELKQAYQQQDYIRIGQIAHTLKGIATPYGFPSLEVLARELELNAKLADSKLILATLNKIEVFVVRRTE